MSSRASKISVVLVSFDRCLGLTVPSIVEHTIRPLAESGKIAKVVIVFSRRAEQTHVDPELLGALDWRDSPLFEVHVVDSDTIDAEIAPTVSRALAYGDPWPKTQGVSLRNHIHFLKLLEISKQFLSSEGIRGALFIRADLLQIEPWDVNELLAEDLSSILVPDWHSWGGFNDRIALIPARFLDAYFNRGQRIYEYLPVYGFLHAESFLKFALLNTPVIKLIKHHFYRVDSAGNRRPENFTARRNPIEHSIFVIRRLSLLVRGRWI
jgi:hypothetical protein